MLRLFFMCLEKGGVLEVILPVRRVNDLHEGRKEFSGDWGLRGKLYRLTIK